MVGVEPVKLPFKVRLCIEGVPNHASQAPIIHKLLPKDASQAPIIHKLLPKDALLECIDCTYRSDNKENCCYIIVWPRNPDNIPKEAALQLQELQD
jgi:hypothetical protein